MTNVVVLIGQVKRACFDEKTSTCYLELKVENPFVDEYDTVEEVYVVRLWRGIYNDLKSISKIKPNILVGIKGRLEIENDKVIIVSERVSFLGK